MDLLTLSDCKNIWVEAVEEYKVAGIADNIDWDQEENVNDEEDEGDYNQNHDFDEDHDSNSSWF